MNILSELDLNTLPARTAGKNTLPAHAAGSNTTNTENAKPLNTENVFNFKEMKRNSLKFVRNSLNLLEFKREKSLFPNVYLPSGSFTRESCSNLLVLKQIRELFQLPVPAVYLGSSASDGELEEFYGAYLEFSLRNIIVNDNVEWDRVSGRLGKSNELKEKIGFDLDKELKILNKVNTNSTAVVGSSLKGEDVFGNY
jgi:hypothetical protein